MEFVSLSTPVATTLVNLEKGRRVKVAPSIAPVVQGRFVRKGNVSRTLGARRIVIVLQVSVVCRGSVSHPRPEVVERCLLFLRKSRVLGLNHNNSMPVALSLSSLGRNHNRAQSRNQDLSLLPL